MDGTTLMAAMTYPGYPPPLALDRYSALAGPCDIALRQADCTTVNRTSMFLAQIGAESGSLRWTEELADGTAYNWRVDLGNTQAGDGPRFKGRSFIQITGRTHYTNLSLWAHSKSYVPTADYFVLYPEKLADDQYAFLGPVWYWTVARPQMNKLADARDIYGATVAVNGGTNNLSGRTARWNTCLAIGAPLLASPQSAALPLYEEDDMPRIVKDKATNVRYLLIGDRPPILVTAAGAAELAELLGLSPTFPLVSHASLLLFEKRMKHPKSAVRAK